MNEEELEKKICLHVKSVMVKKGLDIPKLTELFLANGYSVTKDSIRGKVDRGKFSFAFYLQFMHVIGAEEMQLVCAGCGNEMDILLK